MRRRILLVITDLEIGGTPTVVRELARRLGEAFDVDVEVACLSGWGPVAEELESSGVRVTALGATGMRNAARTLLRLGRLIGRGDFDTVFSFLIHANALCALLAGVFRGVRFVQSIQTTQPWPRWHWGLQRFAQHGAEKIVAPSASVGAAAQRWSGVREEKIVVIPNAVEAVDLEGSGTKRQSDEATEGRYRVGFLGRLDRVKRVPDLVEAVARLEGTELHIFGEGLERRTIEAAVARLGLNDRVTMHGAIAHPREALERMDALVLPSQAEGFGLVLIEAMAAGVPVVATDVPGIRDVVRNERTGLLVPARRPEALADAIRRIMEDASLRKRLVARAAAEVRERYDWSRVIELYGELLNLHRRDRRP